MKANKGTQRSKMKNKEGRDRRKLSAFLCAHSNCKDPEECLDQKSFQETFLTRCLEGIEAKLKY